MASCSKCGYENRPKAKRCGQCGSPIMSAGLGYGESPGKGAPGGGNMLPTIPESGGGGGLPPTIQESAGQLPQPGFQPGEARMGGAASTVQEDPAHLPGPRGAVGPRTQLHEEVSKPIAGWLVVLRSRTMRPYHDIPLFKGRNMLGRSPSRGPHYIEDSNASTEHALAIANDDGVDLTDLGSSNGTVVNNQRIRTHTLQKGDMVKVGKTTMVFVPMPRH